MRNLLQARFNFNLLKHNLKTNRAYIILFTVLFFIAYPSSFIVTILREGTLNSYIGISSIPIMLMILTGIAMFFMPFILQGYLNSKKAVDVYHSLPIKRSDMYLTNALSSFLIILIPYTLNYFLGYGIQALYNVNFIDQHLLLYYMFSMILLLAIQTCNHFVIMNTGTLANSLIHAFVLFLAPFVAYGALSFFMESFILGVSAFDEMLLAYLSPSYGLGRLIYGAEVKQIYLVGAVWFILNIVFTCFNLNLYNKRKSERSEEPFTTQRYFPIVVSLFTGLVLMGLVSLFSASYSWSGNNSLSDFLSLDTLLIPIGLAFAMYIILDFFRYRSTKNFLKAIVHYLIIAATTLSICVVFIVTNLFGYGNFVPAPSNIKEVTLEVSPSLNPLLLQSLDGGYTNKFTLTEPESIQTVTQLHHEILDFYKENPTFNYESTSYIIDGESHSITPYSENAGNVNIQYRLKGGFTVSRNYYIPNSIGQSQIALSGTWEIQSTLHPILNTSVRLANNRLVYVYNDTLTSRAQVQLTDAMRLGISEAYQKDLLAMGTNAFAFQESTLRYMFKYTTEVDHYDYVESTTHFTFIDSRFVNTIAYIDTIEALKASTETRDFEYSLNHIEDSMYGSNSGTGIPSVHTSYDESYFVDVLATQLSFQETQALSGQIQGAHIRSTDKKVLIVLDQSNSYIFFLPTSID